MTDSEIIACACDPYQRDHDDGCPFAEDLSASNDDAVEQERLIRAFGNAPLGTFPEVWR